METPLISQAPIDNMTSAPMCNRCKKYPAITDCGHCTSCFMAITETKATIDRKPIKK